MLLNCSCSCSARPLGHESIFQQTTVAPERLLLLLPVFRRPNLTSKLATTVLPCSFPSQASHKSRNVRESGCKSHRLTRLTSIEAPKTCRDRIIMTSSDLSCIAAMIHHLLMHSFHLISLQMLLSKSQECNCPSRTQERVSL